MIEREMEPYVFSVKNELRILMDNFSNEFKGQKVITDELGNLRGQIHENKKLVVVFREEIEKKLSDSSSKYYTFNKNFEEIKSEFHEITRNFKSSEKNIEALKDKLVQLEGLKDKIRYLENNNDKLSHDIENNISSSFSLKFKAFENDLENLKDKYNSINANTNSFNFNMKALNDKNEVILSELSSLREKANDTNINMNSLNVKQDNLLNNHNTLSEKVSSLNKNVIKIDEGVRETNTIHEENNRLVESDINTLKKNINNLTEDLEDMKKHAETKHNLYDLRFNNVENKVASVASDDEVIELQRHQKEIFVKLSEVNDLYNILKDSIKTHDDNFEAVSENSEHFRQNLEKLLVWQDELNYKEQNVEKGTVSQDDLDKKIRQLASTYDAKIDEIFEYIKNNKPESNEKSEINNNLNNNNTSFIFAIAPSGYINNMLANKSLKGNNTQRISSILRNAEDFVVMSENNACANLREKPINITVPKFLKNHLYNTTDPICYPTVRDELKGYLNKYAVLDRHYGTIVEIEIDGEQKKPKGPEKNSIGSKVEKVEFKPFEAEKEEDEMICCSIDEIENIDDSHDTFNKYEDLIS
jgi:chromosome segregation ATPase